MEIRPTLSRSYVDHADYLRFAVLYPGQVLGTPRPDEHVLPFGGEVIPQSINWNALARPPWRLRRFHKASRQYPRPRARQAQ
jgi:hypothetical protein